MDNFNSKITPILNATDTFIGHTQERLGALALQRGLDELTPAKVVRDSAVLFVLSPCGPANSGPCLVLNKRSVKVKQPGDLCCPGGSLSKGLDHLLAQFMLLPRSPLRRWSHWPLWSQQHREQARTLALLLSASLREAWEEMRLNPLQVSFLGYLPMQPLVMFDRVIYPMVGWSVPQRHFKPNWEVERIVFIPVHTLLDTHRYGRFRPMVAGQGSSDSQPLHHEDLPCFVHEDDSGKELLWGATYRIVRDFLKIGFDFIPPPLDSLPLVEKEMSREYLNGSKYNPN